MNDERSMNNRPEDRTIHIEDPDRCVVCGWEKSPEDDPKSDSMKWFVVQIPHSVVWIYICPKCGAAMGNKNAAENVRKLQIIKESNIIQTRNPLIIPGRN